MRQENAVVLNEIVRQSMPTLKEILKRQLERRRLAPDLTSPKQYASEKGKSHGRT